jgi:hypothetical protein
MKLVTFDNDLVGRIGGDTVVEPIAPSARQFFERGGQVGETGRAFPPAGVTLRAPIPVDRSHPVNKSIVFFQNVDAIIGPEDPIANPDHLTRELDYELELAQREAMESGVSSLWKAIDTFCPIGPYIVTAGEIEAPHNLGMELRVNGDIRQKSSTARMIEGLGVLRNHVISWQEAYGTPAPRAEQWV